MHAAGSIAINKMVQESVIQAKTGLRTSAAASLCAHDVHLQCLADCLASSCMLETLSTDLNALAP